MSAILRGRILRSSTVSLFLNSAVTRHSFRMCCCAFQIPSQLWQFSCLVDAVPAPCLFPFMALRIRSGLRDFPVRNCMVAYYPSLSFLNSVFLGNLARGIDGLYCVSCIILHAALTLMYSLISLKLSFARSLSSYPYSSRIALLSALVALDILLASYYRSSPLYVPKKVI